MQSSPNRSESADHDDAARAVLGDREQRGARRRRRGAGACEHARAGASAVERRRAVEAGLVDAREQVGLGAAVAELGEHPVRRPAWWRS